MTLSQLIAALEAAKAEQLRLAEAAIDKAVQTLEHSALLSTEEKVNAARMVLVYLRHHQRCRPAPCEASGCSCGGAA